MLPYQEEYPTSLIRSRKWTDREHRVDSLITHQFDDRDYEFLCQAYDRCGFVEEVVDIIDEEGLKFDDENILFIAHEILY